MAMAMDINMPPDLMCRAASVLISSFVGTALQLCS